MNIELKLIRFCDTSFNEDLINEYKKWLNTRSINKFFFYDNFPEINDEYISKSIERFSQTHSIGFLIYDSIKQKYIGTCKLDNINSDSATDGIMIGETSYHNLGVGKIVYGMIIKYAKENLKIKFLHGGCTSLNSSMCRIFSFHKYTLFKIKYKSDIIDGNKYDHYFYYKNL